MHLTGYDKLGMFSEAVLSEPLLLEPRPAVNKKTKLKVLFKLPN